MRLTGKQTIVLRLLKEKGDLSGVELTRRSGGRVKLNTVYYVLRELQEKNLVTQSDTVWLRGRGRPRKRYTITQVGAVQLDARLRQSTALV